MQGSDDIKHFQVKYPVILLWFIYDCMVVSCLHLYNINTYLLHDIKILEYVWENNVYEPQRDFEVAFVHCCSTVTFRYS